MGSARPLEGLNLGATVPWGHAETVPGDASNSPMLAKLPKAMGMPADDIASQGSFSRQSSTGASFDLSLAQMRAPLPAGVQPLSRCPSLQDARLGMAPSLTGTPAASPRAPIASKPAARRGGGKDARAMAAARVGDGGVAFGAPFPWPEGGGGARGSSARLPMMEFDGFAAGMSPTIGMGTLGMGGTDDMGIAEEYNDLSWLESELDQREARLSGPTGPGSAPPFSLGGLPFSAPGGPMLPGMGKPAMKRKPAAVPRRRAKAAKGNPEGGKGGKGGKGGGHGGGKGSGRGVDPELSVAVGPEMSPLQAESPDAAETAATGMLNMGEIDAGTEPLSFLSAMDSPVVKEKEGKEEGKGGGEEEAAKEEAKVEEGKENSAVKEDGELVEEVVKEGPVEVEDMEDWAMEEVEGEKKAAHESPPASGEPALLTEEAPAHMVTSEPSALFGV
jgi:hypothetical protein